MSGHSSGLSGRDVAGPLAGVRVVELAGIGPGPFAAMLLADLGADVVRVDRPGGPALGVDPAHDVTNRNKRSVLVDLKAAGRRRERVLDLAERADILIEGYRPGVAERLGVGPDACLARNPAAGLRPDDRLGPGRPARRPAPDTTSPTSPLTGALGHDRHPGGPPAVPANLLGDYAGGSLYLVVGVLAALHHARATGTGQVVDAAIVDGAAHLATMIHGMLAAGGWQDRRGANLLDGGCPFYGVYETADGGYMAVGALEPQFYDEFVAAARHRRRGRRRPRTTPPAGRSCAAASPPASGPVPAQEWTAVFEGTDACVAPVLSLREAPAPPAPRRPAAPSSSTAASPSPPPRPASPRPRARSGCGPGRCPARDTADVARDWDVPG